MDELKKKKKFTQITVSMDTYNQMKKFKELHTTVNFSMDDIINYLFLINNQRIRKEICDRWIQTGTKQSKEDLVIKLNKEQYF